MATYLVRIEVHNLCFGFEVIDGVVGEWCAPVAKWMIGKRGRDVVRYWSDKGAVVTWQRTDVVMDGQEAQDEPVAESVRRRPVPKSDGRSHEPGSRHISPLQSDRR